jgi:hypothetical protein
MTLCSAAVIVTAVVWVDVWSFWLSGTVDNLPSLCKALVLIPSSEKKRLNMVFFILEKYLTAGPLK